MRRSAAIVFPVAEGTCVLQYSHVQRITVHSLTLYCVVFRYEHCLQVYFEPPAPLRIVSNDSVHQQCLAYSTSYTVVFFCGSVNFYCPAL